MPLTVVRTLSNARKASRFARTSFCTSTIDMPDAYLYVCWKLRGGVLATSRNSIVMNMTAQALPAASVNDVIDTA
jgi:hypothetical protein